MPHSYGVIPSTDPDADAPRSGGVASTSPLLPRKHAGEDDEGVATLTSSIGNLSNTILGTGMLTFPLAMASAGLIGGMITCAFSGSVAFFGLYLLSRCAAEAPGHRQASFSAVGQITFPSAALLFDTAIAIKCFGVSISYLILIKDLMPSVVLSLSRALGTSTPPAWALSGHIWITAFMIPLVPLCFLNKLNKLRHTSYVAIFAIAYLVVVVVSCYFYPPPDMPTPGEIHLIRFTPGFISTFPVQVFAFTCAQNIFPIYNELRSNTQERLTIVVGTSIGLATITYEIVSIFGYLTFGSKVGADIIAMYPPSGLFIAIGELAIVILVMFSYPLQVFPCRMSINEVLKRTMFAEKVVLDSEESEDEDDLPVLDSHGHVVSEMSVKLHAILTAVIVCFGFSIAYFVDDLQLVLSFVGSTGSTTISFILPGLFYYKLFRDKPSSSKFLLYGSACLAVYGVLIFVFCLSFNIYKVVQGTTPGAELH